MALETNLNATPYWDDFNEQKDFYRILFRPGVSVQTRELNQLQTILQKQIERFGDHVFKSGTIISGCNFIYNPLAPYVKIKDLQEDGQPVNISSYVGLYIKNSANLQAKILNFETGFESQNPDLNTLYVSYINSGNTFNLTSFSNNDLLDVFNKNEQLYSVSVVNGGTGFSNSDTLHFVSALDVRVSSGTFTNGEIITQATTGARLQVIGIANGINSNNKILSVKPINAEQLSNTSANSTSWTMSSGYNITGNTSSAVANVTFFVGGNANGVISTDSLGVVQTITLSSGGSGYTTVPSVVIKPASASAGVSSLDLTAVKNYAQIRVANNSFTSPVGFGYTFSVTEGIIYQKGIFSRVLPQTTLVSKYSSTPSNVSVGFTSNESIVKYTTDSSLYDNAANTYNETAPGADRLRIRPILYVVNTDVGAANSEFLPLVEFVDGLPSKENRNTVYNEIAKEYERRTFETAGDFVIDSFRASTKEIVSNTTHFNVVIDPGKAYIRGKRIETLTNIPTPIQKGNTVFTKSNQTITANYGNYVKVKNLAGFFDFKSGATITLYDTAKSLLSGVTVGSSATITPAGNAIGTARMRSLVYESGIKGTPEAIYRLYLFDVTMNAGKSFRDVRALYYDGSYDGICDAVTEIDGTSSNTVTFLYDTESPDIIFRTGVSAAKSISDITYTYRTSTQDLTLNANGTIEITAPVSYQFPYSGSLSLSSIQKQDFIIAPVSNVSVSNAAGSVSGGTTLNYLVGTSTSFTTDFRVGDYVRVLETGGSSTIDVRRVENIVNSTYMILNANLSFTDTNANVALFFPAYYPIDLERTGRTITTSANSSVVTIDIANSSLAGTANVVAMYNIRIPSATQINKDLNRDLYVKIYTGNNDTVSASGNNTSGPWSLGIPDVFRLKAVYYGNTAANTDVTKYFYVNSYDDGDKVKNAELRLIKGANLAISNTQWLLAQFDAFDVNSSEGFITINSYNDLINDSTGYSNNTYINTLEVPELLTSDGRYYDVRDCFDFRPFTTNTASYSTSVASATVNPSATVTINTDEKYFPVPDSEITFDIDFYVPRIDSVSINRNNDLLVSIGTPDVTNLKAPNKPADSLLVTNLFIPPYPSLPYSFSNTTFSINNKRVGNDSSIVNVREDKYKVKTISSTSERRSSPRAYTMSSISKLEQRIVAIEKEILLSKLERSIIDKTIPSSNDPAKDRFKNGFLVDSFNDYNVVDLKNVENSCFIDTEKGELQPLKFNYNLESIFDRSHSNTSVAITEDNQLMLPYTEVTLIKQLNASKPKTVTYQSVSSVPEVTVVTEPSSGGGYARPQINGPSEIYENDLWQVVVTNAQPGESITVVGSGLAAAVNRVFYADAAGTWREVDTWVYGIGTFGYTLTFGTSGAVLTYSVNVKSKQDLPKKDTDVDGGGGGGSSSSNDGDGSGKTFVLDTSVVTACTVTVTSNVTTATNVIDFVELGSASLLSTTVTGPIGVFSLIGALGSVTVSSITVGGFGPGGTGATSGDNFVDAASSQGNDTGVSGVDSTSETGDGNIGMNGDGTAVGESVLIDGEVITNSGDLGGYGGGNDGGSGGGGGEIGSDDVFGGDDEGEWESYYITA